jgi:glycine oxidase
VQQLMEDHDLVLCGGGVIGLSIAWAAAQRGWRVLVIEAGQLGRASSWAGAGILPAGATLPAEDPLEQLRSLSHRLHPLWAERLQKTTGIDTEYRTCGGLYLAPTPAERATLAGNRFWWQEHGIEFESWSAEQTIDRVPALRRWIESSPNSEFWSVPGDCRVRNPKHLAALIAACQGLGVEFLEATHVEGLETRGNRVVAVSVSPTPPIAPLPANDEDHQTHSTRQPSPTVAVHPIRTTGIARTTGLQQVRGQRFCVTSGAWSGPLLQSMGIATGILPVRGQMVLYRCPKPPFSMVINEGHRYLVPREDGHVLAGSCEEEVGFDATTTESMIAQLRGWAEQIVPELSAMPIASTWAGLRPGSFDSFPYLGTLHPFENAYVAAGHFRHGLHWSTATAELILQHMRGEPTSIDLAPFRVQRGQAMQTTRQT